MPSPSTFFAWPLIRRVRNSVKKFNGYCTWPFSQASEPVASICASHPETAGGICETLSARWIERHAMGNSLASWLSCNDSGGIDPSKIRQLMQLFIAGCTLRSGMMYEKSMGPVDQTSATLLWLNKNGISQCRTMTLDQSGALQFSVPDHRRGVRDGQSKSSFATDIAINIQRDLRTCHGNYALIGIYGKEGHTMAAWVGQEVCFFDPNFGEFYFPDKHSFISWFPVFFNKSPYSWPLVGLCQSYDTVILARRQ